MSIVINPHVSIYSNDQFKSLCCEWKYLWRLTAILCYTSQIWFNLRPTSPAASPWIVVREKSGCGHQNKSREGMHDRGEGVWTVCRMEQKWVRFWNWMIHIQSHPLRLSWSTALLIFVWYFKLFNPLRRISCHGRNHSQASCEYSLTIFLCCQHHSEYLLLGSKFSTNLLFAASKCHVTIQQRGSSRCSKWPNRKGSLQWWNIPGSLYKEEEAAEKDH